MEDINFYNSEEEELYEERYKNYLECKKVCKDYLANSDITKDEIEEISEELAWALAW